MAKLAFIGLGNMGSGMAANLVKAGHDVKAFDLSPAAVAQAVEQRAKLRPPRNLAVRVTRRRDGAERLPDFGADEVEVVRVREVAFGVANERTQHTAAEVQRADDVACVAEVERR